MYASLCYRLIQIDSSKPNKPIYVFLSNFLSIYNQIDSKIAADRVQNQMLYRVKSKNQMLVELQEEEVSENNKDQAEIIRNNVIKKFLNF